MIYIFWTAKDEEEAKTIIKALLEKRWIACATIFPQVLSLYRWEGKIEESFEAKVLLKSTAEYFQKVAAYIGDKSSYDVPEIASVPTEKVSSKYSAWLKESIKN